MTKAKPTKAKPNRRLPALSNPAQRPNEKISSSAGLDRLHAAARQAGIECLDTEWRGKDARYRLRCAHGHEFMRDPSALTNKGIICPECRDNARLARIQAAAAQRGGRCLETRYLGKNVRYRFVCAEGHHWTILPSAIVHAGTWCRRCATKQHKLNRLLDNGLKRLQNAAQARGGTCLASVYTGLKAHYVFRCAEGHEWKAPGREIVRNSAWCLLCANIDKIRAATRQRPPKQAQATVPKRKNRPPKISPAQAKSKRLQYPLALRKGLKLNQQDFWAALGVSQSGGSRYERGRKIPKPVATLLELVHVKKLKLKEIEVGDIEIINYLKAHEPDLFAKLKKAVLRDPAQRVTGST